MNPRFLALIALLSLAATPVIAQDTAPTDAEPTPVADNAAVTTVVTVTAQQPTDAGPQPIANAAAALHILVPPHQVLRTERATTDEEGRARFEIPVVAGQEVVAEVDAGRRFFSDPTPITEAPLALTVESVGESHDPSLLYATGVQTIIEPWEGYVTITQVWSLSTRGDAIYTPDMEAPSSVLRIPLPAEAEGIRVVQPAEMGRVIGTSVAVGVEVAPPELAEAGSGHVVLQYSLKTHEQADVSWEQTFTMDVDALEIIVPQGSTFSRHPSMEIALDGPRCGEVADGSFCFDYFGDTASLNLQRDVSLAVARGPVSAGQVVRVDTSGWPARSPAPRRAAAAAGLLGFFGVILLYVRDRRHRTHGDSRVREALTTQQEALFASAAELDRRLDDGLILQHEYDIAREGIRHQLGVLYRRERELDARSPEASQA